MPFLTDSTEVAVEGIGAARRIGWMSRHGERLALPAKGRGEAACPATGERYRLDDDVLTFLE